MAVPVPNLDQILVFAILGATLALFIWDRFRYDLVALTALVAGLAVGVVPVADAFKGFSDDVVVIVGSALVISAGIGKSVLVGRALRYVEPHLRNTGARVFALTLGVTVLSALMKNVGALAIFLPMAVQLSRRSDTPISALLMPMAFGSLVGGLVTLVGTSPNILVSRVRQELGGEPFAMFDFAPVGLAIAAVALVFLAFGWRLLPLHRKAQAGADEAFEVGPYMSEAEVPEGSAMIGKTIGELEALTEGEIIAVALLREGRRRYVPNGAWRIFAGDVLILQGDPHRLTELVAESGIELVGAKEGAPKELPTEEVGVVEAVVTPDSLLVGATARQVRLRDVHGLNLLGVARRGESITTPLRKVRIRAGDVLALQGPSAAMPDALRALNCLPLVDRGTGLGQKRQDILPILILAVTMGLVGFGIVPVAPAFFAAAVLTVVLGVLTLREAYEAVDTPILILLACLLPISDAVACTGGAELIAGGLAEVAGLVPATGALALIILLAMGLTPFLNNAATALILAPVAAGVATRLGFNADPFLMAVAVGCACDFLTPVGHQCNTLVLGPGGYRFGDYWKLGLPLSIIVLVVATLVIPLVWPLRPGG
ncbi:SLC13 family permease [Roseomonas terrae]|uniref:SLC13 family permease n=1 Tax=Neoroseomonas terrae TaxID=424799 RepID=A0ABS5EDY0_9PROT|nr:SLC13 family permease [Neoroseomonas terrae]MBR0649217.1 SLC13 family permease [Neoroseomonas terrae]